MIRLLDGMTQTFGETWVYRLANPPLVIDLEDLAPMPSLLVPGSVYYVETNKDRAARLKRARRAAYMRKWRAVRKAA